MENNAVIHAKISRMADIRRQQEALKTEWAELEGFFLKQCQVDLEDTKRQTVAYTCASGKVTATIAKTIKITWPAYLKQIFGEAYKDAVTEDVKYKLSAPATRMLTGIWTNSYSRMTVAEVISQLPCDERSRQALGKKLKGASYDTDKKNLMAIGGFDEQSSEQYAWFVSEAATWESFRRLLKVNKKEEAAAMGEVLELINGAIVVEETPKLAFEIMNDDRGQQTWQP